MCGYFCVWVQPAQPAYGCSSEPQCVEEAFHEVKSIPVSFTLRFIFFLKIMCMCLWVGGVVHVSAGARRRPWIWTLEAGVTGCGEKPNAGAGSWFQFSGRSLSTLNCWAVSVIPSIPISKDCFLHGLLKLPALDEYIWNGRAWASLQNRGHSNLCRKNSVDFPTNQGIYESMRKKKPQNKWHQSPKRSCLGDVMWCWMSTTRTWREENGKMQLFLDAGAHCMLTCPVSWGLCSSLQSQPSKNNKHKYSKSWKTYSLGCIQPYFHCG